MQLLINILMNIIIVDQRFFLPVEKKSSHENFQFYTREKSILPMKKSLKLHVKNVYPWTILQNCARRNWFLPVKNYKSHPWKTHLKASKNASFHPWKRWHGRQKYPLLKILRLCPWKKKSDFFHWNFKFKPWKISKSPVKTCCYPWKVFKKCPWKILLTREKNQQKRKNAFSPAFWFSRVKKNTVVDWLQKVISFSLVDFTIFFLKLPGFPTNQTRS